ncbi:MAG: helix-turn-helix transcriptional regulator, partial [Vallitaleaceae bacterium]|nr:helix-turn-helix transcriptional regulator [Vallitaleaceae bacterium]
FDYLIHYRITMSKALLHDNNLSIQGISEAVGYKNANNFIRNFKKLVGETPHQYRINWKV